MSKDSANLWDQKEQTYPRFDSKNCDFQKQILATASSWGVDFNGQNIIEIGAGTGNYTFLLGELAKKVLAVDFSANMLKTLDDDAKKLNLSHKITTQKADFKEFDTTQIYDIAFAAMTPAIFDEEAFEKFNRLATHKIWLGWAGKRKSKLLDAVFEAHAQSIHPHNTAQKLKSWLEAKNISYQNTPFDDSWGGIKSQAMATKDQVLHLKMHDITPDMDKISQVLSKFADENGNVYDKTEVKVELIAWKD